MAENLKKTLSKLSKRGPHRVQVGDLSHAGLSGKIYTPASGNGIPGIAFAHDWIKPLKYYHQTLRHLASWGIAVAAPDTETGFLPDHRGLADDIESCIQILAGVRLGSGKVTVSPAKLGVAGHGMGAGAAILAAADRDDAIRAVGALYPAPTSPSCVDAARRVTVPGLIVGAAETGLFESGEPAKVAALWKGDVVYREMKKGTRQNFCEDTLVQLLIGGGLPQFSARETTRGLLTGFLLHQLDKDSKYQVFSDPTASSRTVSSYADEELRELARSADLLGTGLFG